MPSWYVKIYWDFLIIHKKAPCCRIELKASSLHHCSHSSSSSITNLITGCSRYQRAISAVIDAPTISLTYLTNPLLSAFVATIFAIDQLSHSAAASLSRAISLTLHVHLMAFHFCRHWSVAKTSFLNQLQNSLEICCTLLQGLQH